MVLLPSFTNKSLFDNVSGVFILSELPFRVYDAFTPFPPIYLANFAIAINEYAVV